MDSFKKDKQFYNVTNFGAVGDGKANDTLAIPAAIDACSQGKLRGVKEGKYWKFRLRDVKYYQKKAQQD